MADSEKKPHSSQSDSPQIPSPDGPVEVPAPPIPSNEPSPGKHSESSPAIANPASTSNDGSPVASSPSAPNPSSSSQAVTPDQPPFQIPARNYPRDVRLLQYTPPQSPPPPNTTLPRFFKLLAAFIFITGSSASLVAFLYQRYLLPKIALTRARVTALHQTHLSNYDKLVVSINSLLAGNSTLFSMTQRKLESRQREGNPTKEAVALADSVASQSQDEQASEEPEKQPLLQGEAGENEDKAVPREAITQDLCTSMEKLATTLQSFSPPATQEKVPTYMDKERTPSQNLLRSLETLTTFLSNESFYASTPNFPGAAYGYSYGSSASAIPVRSGMDKEKISQLKSEIRSLKGALLTRKNFAPIRDDL